MSFKMVLIAIFLPLAACGGDNSNSTSTDQSRTASAAEIEADKKSLIAEKKPRWVVSIDGLPEQSGKIITAVTMGANGRYGLGGSGFSATIAVNEDAPSGHMMFTYNDARCFNRGDASVIAEGDRAILSGQVMCMPKSGGDEKSAALEGWFELEKQP